MRRAAPPFFSAYFLFPVLRALWVVFRALLLRLEFRFARVFLAVFFRAVLFLPSLLAWPDSPRRSADFVLR
ncbi:MAG: hypothetical protein WBL57_07370, partial [Methylovirgula sp.]